MLAKVQLQGILHLPMRAYTYILLCADGSFYTGSTKHLERRLMEHQTGEGANHTKKRSPVKLVYYEEYNRIDEAFYQEKQIQGWSRKKKEALINGWPDKLKKAAECMNESHWRNYSSPHSLRLRSGNEEPNKLK